MFGQKRHPENISLDALRDEVGLIRGSMWPNRQDSYHFTIVNFDKLAKDRVFRFREIHPHFGRNVNVFIQLDPNIFRDVRLFEPIEGGEFVSVDPHKEHQISGKNSDGKPLLDDWILFFRNNCDSQVRENNFKIVLSHRADLFTVGVDVRVGTKLARGMEGKRLSSAAMDLLLKDEINLQEIERDLRVVLGRLGGRIISTLPDSDKFNLAHSKGMLSRLELHSGEAHHASALEAKEQDLGNVLINTAKARLEKNIITLSESEKEIHSASEDLQNWKRAAMGCRSGLEQLFEGLSTNHSECIETDTNLQLWLAACDLFIVCEQVKFGQSLLDYEDDVTKLFDRVNKEVSELKRDLVEIEKKVKGGKFEDAREEQRKQADHRRTAEIEIIHEFGATLRVAAGTSLRAAEKVVDTASGLLDKISSPLPGTAHQHKIEDKSKTEKEKGNVIKEKSPPDYDSSIT